MGALNLASRLVLMLMLASGLVCKDWEVFLRHCIAWTRVGKAGKAQVIGTIRLKI